MNKLKKYAGYLWMITGPLMIIFMAWQAYDKITSAAEGFTRTNAMLQWMIILVIFIPICIGFFIFGKYAAQGEYDR